MSLTVHVPGTFENLTDENDAILFCIRVNSSVTMRSKIFVPGDTHHHHDRFFPIFKQLLMLQEFHIINFLLHFHLILIRGAVSA